MHRTIDKICKVNIVKKIGKKFNYLKKYLTFSNVVRKIFLKI